jgi:hypothetical protein
VNQNVIWVSALVPYINSITNGVAETYGRLTALPIGAPTAPLYTVDASSPTVAAGIGAGPSVFDFARRQVILGGCYQRVSGSLAGDPATAKCTTLTGLNPIRFIDVDSGKDAVVRIFDLTATVHGTETTALVLGGKDASGVPQILYAVSRTPDVLVEIELPPQPGQDPFVRRATPLPLSPSGALLIERPKGQTGPDLIAIVGSANSQVSIYDAGAGQVVAQVNGLGDFPFAIAQLLDPATGGPAGGDRARLVTSVFGNCRLGFLDVDYAEPWNARLRGLVGNCPQ